MITVYILHSESTGRYYAGFTSNLNARIKKHRSGQNKSTRHAQDWKTIWTQSATDRTMARNFEIKIKSRGIERFLSEYPATKF